MKLSEYLEKINVDVVGNLDEADERFIDKKQLEKAVDRYLIPLVELPVNRAYICDFLLAVGYTVNDP